jgi:hypothetical protein
MEKQATGRNTAAAMAFEKLYCALTEEDDDEYRRSLLKLHKYGPGSDRDWRERLAMVDHPADGGMPPVRYLDDMMKTTRLLSSGTVPVICCFSLDLVSKKGTTVKSATSYLEQCPLWLRLRVHTALLELIGEYTDFDSTQQLGGAPSGLTSHLSCRRNDSF